MELGGCWVGQTPLPLLALWSGGSLLLEAGCWVKAEVVSQRLNTALVPICYLDKWLYANISLGLERRHKAFSLCYRHWDETYVRALENSDLKDLMRKAGEVTFVDAHRPNKNEGVVEFASRSDMKNAISKLDGSDLNGRKLKIFEDSRRSSQ
ncbi:hypothetical protein NQZ68_022365 [Dissostichus eleginoides]|nr:hypothetical protein NQZ68_022365 [Dissostichus eleginoides]